MINECYISTVEVVSNMFETLFSMGSKNLTSLKDEKRRRLQLLLVHGHLLQLV
jgi:hypothetical protein